MLAVKLIGYVIYSEWLNLFKPYVFLKYKNKHDDRNSSPGADRLHCTYPLLALNYIPNTMLIIVITMIIPLFNKYLLYKYWVPNIVLGTSSRI